MGNVVDFFTGNLILNLAILAWAIAQGLKIIITFLTKKKLDWHYLVASGGMPSSHSAFVCACAAAVGYMYGWGSPMFGIAAVVVTGNGLPAASRSDSSNTCPPATVTVQSCPWEEGRATACQQNTDPSWPW